MTLAFYKVDNQKEFSGDYFDDFINDTTKVKEELSKLSDEELKMYNLDNEYDRSFFREDYNKEELDGGWWCIVIND